MAQAPVTTAGVILNRYGEAYGVAFSLEDVVGLFNNFPRLAFMVCVDIPRSTIVTTSADAARFFAGEE